MEYCDFAFNPQLDKIPVSQTGFIDLKSAMVNNVIPSQIVDTEESYNGIDDPSSILGKPRDVFEAMDMQSYINNYNADDSDSANG